VGAPLVLAHALLNEQVAPCPVHDEGAETMRIAAWMKTPVISVKPRDSLQHARELLEQHRINQLPVIVDGHVVGIVTDRDLRDAFPSVFDVARGRKRRAHSGDPDAVAVEDVMSRTVVTLPPQAFVADAARTMRRERIGAIPIVEGGRLVGILTRSDILDALVEVTGTCTSG
jgi:acetoin utilization protein AcuB